MRQLLSTAVLAILWFLSGYVIGAGLDLLHTAEVLGLAVPMASLCGLLNLLIGFLLLLRVISKDRPWRMFYEGPRPGEEGEFVVGVLWAMPIALLLGGVVLWLVGVLLRSFSK